VVNNASKQAESEELGRLRATIKRLQGKVTEGGEDEEDDLEEGQREIES
jgi:hypothetical protein